MRFLHSFLLPLPALAALAALTGALLLAAAPTSSAQTTAAPVTQLSAQSQADLKAVAALVSEIQAQQKAITDNQNQIDQRIATLAETIRLARIWAKRGGGSPGSK